MLLSLASNFFLSPLGAPLSLAFCVATTLAAVATPVQELAIVPYVQAGESAASEVNVGGIADEARVVETVLLDEGAMSTAMPAGTVVENPRYGEARGVQMAHVVDRQYSEDGREVVVSNAAYGNLEQGGWLPSRHSYYDDETVEYVDTVDRGATRAYEPPHRRLVEEIIEDEYIPVTASYTDTTSAVLRSAPLREYRRVFEEEEVIDATDANTYMETPPRSRRVHHDGPRNPREEIRGGNDYYVPTSGYLMSEQRSYDEATGRDNMAPAFHRPPPSYRYFTDEYRREPAQGSIYYTELEEDAPQRTRPTTFARRVYDNNVYYDPRFV